MTDHQLNLLLALEVMSWYADLGQWWHGEGIGTGYTVEEEPGGVYWNPAGDWGCVGEVLNRVPLALIPVKGQWLAMQANAVTCAAFDNLTCPAVVVVGKKGIHLEPNASPTRALSLAALAAVRGEK